LIENEYFPGYEMFIGVRDYGKQLCVSWYLTGDASVIAKLFNLVPASSGILMIFLSSAIAYYYLLKFIFGRFLGGSGKPKASMDIFDVEELSAFVTISHRALLDSVEELMTGIDQDFSKVEKKSRGFLNIS